MKKVIAGVLSLAIAGTLTVPAYAETQTIEYDSTKDNNASIVQEVGVEAERSEWFSVTLPKNVVLEVDKIAGTASFNYDVTVAGEVSKSHYIRVIPLPDAEITDETDTLSYAVKVEQTKKRWSWEDLSNSSSATGTYVPVVTGEDGEAVAASLDPGKYFGTVKYLISCDDTGIYTPATCTTPAYCTGYDADDSGVVEATELLETPVAKGKPLGHDFTDTTSFPSMCERCKELVYGISTPEQYTAFVNTVNTEGKNLSGCEVVLCNDLDLSGITYDSGIGNASTTFAGVFNGNGYTISNLTINDSVADGYTGMFSHATAKLTVKNLTLYAPVIKTADSNKTEKEIRAGSVVGCVKENTYFNIEGVQVLKGHMDIVFGEGATTMTTGYVGGLVGYAHSGYNTGNYPVIKNCAVYDFTLNATQVVESTDINVVNNSKLYGGNLAGYLLSWWNGPTHISVISCVPFTKMVLNAPNVVAEQAAHSPNHGDYSAKISRAHWSNNVLKGSAIHINAQVVENNYATTNPATQEALDILNTDQPGTWVLDLEGKTSGGYPVLKY